MARKRRQKKFSSAEQLAYNLGQAKRVQKSIDSGKDSRVLDAYRRGLQGKSTKKTRKSLYGD